MLQTLQMLDEVQENEERGKGMSEPDDWETKQTLENPKWHLHFRGDMLKLVMTTQMKAQGQRTENS